MNKEKLSMHLMKNTTISLVILAALSQAVLADVFPAEPFNGLQITYSVAGATLGTPVDAEGFTLSRTVDGTFEGNAITISGVATATNGWGATIDVSVSAEGQESKNFHEKKFPKDGLYGNSMSQPFTVTLPLKSNAKTASFTISLEGSYNAGSRGVVVEGVLKRVQPAKSPKPSTTPLTDKASQWVKPEPLPDAKTSQAPVSMPQIIGDSESVAKITQALNILKEKAPKQYEMVAKNIGVIKVVESGSGMYVAENPPRFEIGKASVEQYGSESPMSPVMLAGTIVHDAAHSKLYQDYQAKNPGSTVPEEAYSGTEAESKCLAAQYDAVQKLGGNEFVLDDIKNSIKDEYWKVDFEKRWW